MTDVVLSLVDPGRVGERAVLGFTRYPELAPFSTGTGDLNLLCGKCGFVLVASATDADTYPKLLIRCPSCGGYNDPPADHWPRLE
jgi:hypothetical protein